MSTPPLPEGLRGTLRNRIANRLHSVSIHLLRRAALEDRASGLSPERLSLLSVLVFGGPRPASELADIEMVSRPAISRIVNALETTGQVRRERSASDRRTWLIHATDAGCRVVEQGRKRRLRRIAAELASLTREELGKLDAATRLLEKLDR